MKPYSLSCASSRGFTLLELLVASFLGLLMSALVVSGMLTNKKTYSYDLVRTRIDQNLRSALDVMSAELRVGGENLPTNFPAFEIVDGTSGAPDELIIRRNLLDEVLPVCQSVTAASTTLQVYFAIGSPPTAACNFASQTHNYNTWRNYRSDNGGTVKAYIYNVSTRNGEFFAYSNEGSSATSYHILRNGGAWQYGYTVAGSSIYILEEWRFKLEAGILKFFENGESVNPSSIADSIIDFQAKAILDDGTEDTSFTRSDSWGRIDALEVVLTGQGRFDGRPVTRKLSSRFFPRNILSH